LLLAANGSHWLANKDLARRTDPRGSAALKLQFATSKSGRGGRRKPPLVFTEHGAIMVAAILNSPRAVEMSVYVVRAFVKLRKLLGSNKELARRFAQLEARLDKKLTAHNLRRSQRYSRPSVNS
jgi:hypothetical protein